MFLFQFVLVFLSTCSIFSLYFFPFSSVYFETLLLSPFAHSIVSIDHSILSLTLSLYFFSPLLHFSFSFTLQSSCFLYSRSQISLSCFSLHFFYIFSFHFLTSYSHLFFPCTFASNVYSISNSSFSL